MTDMTRLQEMLYRADAETIARDLKWIGEKKAQAVAALLATPPAPVDVRVAELIAADKEYDEAASYDAYVKDPVGNGARKAAATKRRAAALALLDGQQAGVDDYRAIARLIGSIFFYGNFKAETANERALESLLRKTGNFYETEDEVLAALGGGGRG